MSLNPTQHRAVTRAHKAWHRGRPHEAYELLMEAGLKEYWPTFRRAVMGAARARYVRSMARYSATR